MPTRYIAKNYPIPDSTSNANGFGFDPSDRLTVNRVKAATGAADSGIIPISAIETKTASFTISAADHGKTFICDSATTIVATLPATVAGFEVTLVVKQLTTAGGHAFSPAAVDKVLGNGLTKADDADLVCTAATDRVGDLVTLVGDGVDGWYIKAVSGTWA